MSAFQLAQTAYAPGNADNNNILPAKLRAQILSLAQFTDQHTSKVLARKDVIDVLLDINTSMMRGLRQQKDIAA